ncbi:MAG: hypothetical protein IT373_30710 [Polyangiaceae bacterium]|nr:hypothetical protein [Polyangiaceae bacterium]
MVRSQLPLVALLAACGAGGEPLTEPAPFERAGYPAFSAVWQIATHNAYWVDRGAVGDAFAGGTSERIADQLLADHARSLELDIHRDPDAPGRWRVHHTVPGNGLCAELGECLGLLRAVHYAVPEHEVVTIVIELKELFAPNFDASHTIQDLDRLLGDELGARLWRPAELLAQCDGHLGEESLSACVARVGWPGTGALRGRFLVALLGNWDSFSQGTVDWARYATLGDIRERAAFPMASAWKLDHAALPPPLPSLVSPEELARAAEQSVLLQVEAFDDSVAPAFLARGAVVRMDTTTPAAELEAIARRMQLLQTDVPSEQPDERGPAEPFRVFADGSVPPDRLREPGVRLGLAAPPLPARAFAYRQVADDEVARWQATVSFGADASRRGCLRAASALGGAEAASAMVCGRKVSGKLAPAEGGGAGTPDAERFFASFVTCQGGTCNATELGSSEGATGGVGELLSLRVRPDGAGGGCARAEAARLVDRALEPMWSPVGSEVCFAAPLRYQGLARPTDAATVPAPAWFFGARVELAAGPAPLVASAFEAVAIEPVDAQLPVSSDAALLVDASVPSAP